MSTSHYSSRPFRGLQGVPNTKRYTKLKYTIIALLLIVDLLALIGSTDIVESLALVLLVLANLWALNYTRP